MPAVVCIKDESLRIVCGAYRSDILSNFFTSLKIDIFSFLMLNFLKKKMFSRYDLSVGRTFGFDFPQDISGGC